MLVHPWLKIELSLQYLQYRDSNHEPLEPKGSGAHNLSVIHVMSPISRRAIHILVQFI